MINSDKIENVDSLESNKEEADARLLLHVNHAANSGYTSVTVIADDTDVMILCLAFVHQIYCDIYIGCGNKNRTKLLSINKIASTLGKEVCESLLGYHAYTGCDTVSAFSGQGKLKGLKLVTQSKDFQRAFKDMGRLWTLSDEVFTILQEFTCNMYAARSPICEVNKLRYQLW